jgi:hypothetical protein
MKVIGTILLVLNVICQFLISIAMIVICSWLIGSVVALAWDATSEITKARMRRYNPLSDDFIWFRRKAA